MTGYHDHHVHILSLIAARRSIDVSAARCPTIPDVLRALSRAPGDGWLRAWGFDDALVAERRAISDVELDRAVGDRPVVIHHRGGHERTYSAPAREGDAHAPPLPRAELAAEARELSRELSRHRVVALTDCTASNGPEELALLRSLPMRQAITAMVGIDHVEAVPGPATWAKIDAPAHEVRELVGRAHDAGWPVALHVDDIEDLDAALAALEASPPPEGRWDRLEHLALALPDQVARLARLPVVVVTQPSFLLHRGAKYRAQVSTVEQAWLYRVGSLVRAGVRVCFSSDAPVAPCRPHEWIETAVHRCGFNRGEAVSWRDARGIAEIATCEPGSPAPRHL